MKNRKRRNWLWLFTVLLFLALVSAALVFAMMNHQASRISSNRRAEVRNLEEAMLHHELPWSEVSTKLTSLGFTIEKESFKGVRTPADESYYVGTRKGEVFPLAFGSNSLTRIALTFYTLRVYVSVKKDRVNKISQQVHYDLAF